MKTRLPLITAIGGVSPAGRSAGHHAYRRLVSSALSEASQRRTHASLAALTGRLRRGAGGWQDGKATPVDLDAHLQAIGPELERHSLIRKLEDNLFDPARLLSHQRATIANPDGDMLEFELRKKHLPNPLPQGWILVEDHPDPEDKVWVRAHENFEVMLPDYYASTVNSAGQLPSGFEPGKLYASRNHPRALQLTIFAASDALNSLGLDWETLRQRVPADQISVYAGSGMGQLDYNGYGGMLQARLIGRKVTSKQLPLGYAEMPADFINAYVLGNLGSTGTNVAACATFLYNLRQGIRDIHSGSHRVVLVGTSEAPLVPEIFEGFATMGALADDAGLRLLDRLGAADAPDHRRACRPFGNNCGFTLSESAQCIILMDDELALELGADILGSVNDVFVHADGNKKSIASPGLGNYLSVAKAAAATRQVIGEEGLRRRSYVQAHGTGTPQNRQTESEILSRVATAFGIESWPVSAVKAYVGHSLASSAGDQLMATLGVWQEGWIPGITTIDEIAADVTDAGLEFQLQHREVGASGMDATLINSKGFGGNNATASILAPHVTRRMLEKRHGKAAFAAYEKRLEATRERIDHFDTEASAGSNDTIYNFGHKVLGGDDIEMDDEQIRIRDLEQAVSLGRPDLYGDMHD